MGSRFRIRAFLATAVVLLSSAAANAEAWNVAGTGNWSLNTNWDPQTVPNGTGAIADLITDLGGLATSVVDSNQTVGQIRYGGSIGTLPAISNGWLINPTSVLTLNNNGGSLGTINGEARNGALIYSGVSSGTASSSVAFGAGTLALDDHLFIVSDTTTGADNPIFISSNITGTNKNVTIINNAPISAPNAFVNTSRGPRLNGQASTFTGNVFIEKGYVNLAPLGPGTSLVFGDANNLVTLGSAANDSAAVLITGGGSGAYTQTNPNPFKLVGSGVLTIGSTNVRTAATLIYSGAIDLNGSDLNLAKNGPNTVLAFTGEISGVGNVTTFATGSITYSGANTYTGNTTVSTGTLIVNGSSIPDGLGKGNVTLSTGTFLALAGDETINGLSGTAGTVRPSTAAARSFTFGGNDQTSTFGGVLANNGGGVMSVTKIGAGTQTLTGTSTATGTTTISDGALQIGNGGTTGALGASTSIVNNAGLIYNRSNAIIIGNVISGSGTVTQEGTGTTTLTSDNSYGGTTTINAGTLQIGNGGTTGTLGTGGNVVNNSTLALSRSDAMVVGNAISGTGSVSQTGTGTTTFSNANTYTGDTIVSSGTLELTGTHDLGVGGGTYSVGSAGGSSLVLNGGTAGISGTAVNDIKIGDAVSTEGTFNNNGGSVNIPSGALYVGNEGTGHATQNAGSTTAYILTIADKAGSSGDFTLNGGDLTLATDGGSLVYVGAGGALTQNNGNVGAVAVYVDGAYNFNGGTLKVGYFDPNSSGLVQTSSSNPSLLDVTTNSTTIDGDYTLAAGTFDIGASESLTVSQNATLSSGALWNLQFDSGSEDFGLLSVGGSLDLAGITLNFEDVGAGTLTGLSYLLAEAGSPILGSALDLNTPDGYFVNVAGNQLLLQQVPEPGSMVLACMAVAGFRVFRRRRA